MPLLFVRNDLTEMHADALVCPTDAHCSASGGTDAAVRKKGGLRLRAACRKLGTLPPGGVHRTDGFNLPCRYIFHVRGPVWQGGDTGETQALADCYRNVLQAAGDSGCESVAFPVLSAGAFGFPPDVALHTAVQAIRAAPQTSEMTVYLVLYDALCVSLAERYQFLQSNFTQTQFDAAPRVNRQTPKQPSFRRASDRMPTTEQRRKPKKEKDVFESADADLVFYEASIAPPKTWFKDASLEELLSQPDESFSEMLLRLIDEKGLTDAECYKKANIDRKLFSKIRSNRLYKPSKATALAFAVALELSLPQTCELLQKAGYAFSHSSKFDVIVEYFIGQGMYDIFTINEALFAYDQTLLC